MCERAGEGREKEKGEACQSSVVGLIDKMRLFSFFTLTGDVMAPPVERARWTAASRSLARARDERREREAKRASFFSFSVIEESLEQEKKDEK